MDTLISLLKNVAPVLATAVAGPAGGAAVGWLASKLGIPDATVEGITGTDRRSGDGNEAQRA